MKLTILAGIICFLVCGDALENGLARTPPMGWVSCWHQSNTSYRIYISNFISLHGKGSVVIQTAKMIQKTALGMHCFTQ
jgi:hypothetical protein